MSLVSHPAKSELRTEHGIGDLGVRRLGRMEYEAVWHAMQAFTDNRGPDTPDELWVVQHPPVFTLGQAGRPEHILAAGEIPVIRVDRGGQVTYHGPGQIVAYPLLDIRRLHMGVKELVELIEEAVIRVLDSYGVRSGRITGAPGVYIGGEKIAALGLRVRNGRSFHGLAFNVEMDLEPYLRINPCGFEGLRVTQLSDFTSVRIGEVEDRLVEILAGLLGYTGKFRPAGNTLP